MPLKRVTESQCSGTPYLTLATQFVVIIITYSENAIRGSNSLDLKGCVV
jgi:hypothetical protein